MEFLIKTGERSYLFDKNAFQSCRKKKNAFPDLVQGIWTAVAQIFCVTQLQSYWLYLAGCFLLDLLYIAETSNSWSEAGTLI